MNLLPLSDIHRETGPFDIDRAALDACDVVVLAGDIDEGTKGVEWAKTIGKSVVYVPGNHEFWSLSWTKDMFETMAMLRDAAQLSNVHVLDNEVVVIGGTRFLGATLWTNFGGHMEGHSDGHPDLVECALRFMRDYGLIGARSWFNVKKNKAYFTKFCAKHFPRHDIDRWFSSGKFHPAIALALHRQSVAWLESVLENEPFEGETVVVTHHSPTWESLRRFGLREYQFEEKSWEVRGLEDRNESVRVAAYASNLDPLIRRYAKRINLWIHGHLHCALDFAVEGVRVFCNPVGYRYGPDFEFDREKHIVNLDDGLMPALRPDVAKARATLVASLEDFVRLEPHINEKNYVLRGAVREACENRAAEFKSEADRIFGHVQENLQPGHGGGASTFFLVEDLMKSARTNLSVNGIYGSIFSESPIGVRAAFKRDLKAMHATIVVLDAIVAPGWLEALRQKCIGVAIAVLKALASARFDARVAGPILLTRWRHVPSIWTVKVYLPDVLFTEDRSRGPEVERANKILDQVTEGGFGIRQYVPISKMSEAGGAIGLDELRKMKATGLRLRMGAKRRN